MSTNDLINPMVCPDEPDPDISTILMRLSQELKRPWTRRERERGRQVQWTSIFDAGAPKKGEQLAVEAVLSYSLWQWESRGSSYVFRRPQDIKKSVAMPADWSRRVPPPYLRAD